MKKQNATNDARQAEALSELFAAWRAALESEASERRKSWVESSNDDSSLGHLVLEGLCERGLRCENIKAFGAHFTLLRLGRIAGAKKQVWQRGEAIRFTEHWPDNDWLREQESNGWVRRVSDTGITVVLRRTVSGVSHGHLLRADDPEHERRVFKALDSAKKDEDFIHRWGTILVNAENSEKLRTYFQQPLDSGSAINARQTPYNEPATLSPSIPLNQEQRDAWDSAQGSISMQLILGPPGTGKTRTLASIIQSLSTRGMRVLVLSASNYAVDNLVEKLDDIGAGEMLLRLGNPDRILDASRAFSMDTHRSMSPYADAIRELEREIQQADLKERKGLFKALRDTRTQSDRWVLAKHPIQCATLVGFLPYLRDDTFDICVVDEASQVKSPDLVPALMRCKRILLCGDHRQLPPVTLSEFGTQHLGKSLFESIYNACAPSKWPSHDWGMSKTEERPQCGISIHALKTQYRMPDAIADFASESFYSNRLEHSWTKPSPSVFLPWFSEKEKLILLDVAGAGFEATYDPQSKSLTNILEAELIADLLSDFDTPPHSLGIISAYRAQLEYLRVCLHSHCSPGVSLGTVDSFQGQERELMIISTVRSTTYRNEDRSIGFLKDPRRLNVALTRARLQCLVLCDSSLMGGNAYWNELITYTQSLGSYHSVFETPFSAKLFM